MRLRFDRIASLWRSAFHAIARDSRFLGTVISLVKRHCL
jgi:hypothetical protein